MPTHERSTHPDFLHVLICFAVGTKTGKEEKNVNNLFQTRRWSDIHGRKNFVRMQNLTNGLTATSSRNCPTVKWEIRGGNTFIRRKEPRKLELFQTSLTRLIAPLSKPIQIIVSNPPLPQIRPQRSILHGGIGAIEIEEGRRDVSPAEGFHSFSYERSRRHILGRSRRRLRWPRRRFQRRGRRGERCGARVRWRRWVMLVPSGGGAAESPVNDTFTGR